MGWGEEGQLHEQLDETMGGYPEQQSSSQPLGVFTEGSPCTRHGAESFTHTPSFVPAPNGRLV